MQNDLKTFEDSVGLRFNEPALLRQAFTHRSYLNEHREGGLGHNERLEFLGDAVLELVSTRFLYENFPEKPEGELTALRAALVNATTCAEVAVSLHMNDYLLLSRGEAKDNGRARQVLLANAFEAVVGAVYLDLGYDVAQKFIATHLLTRLDDILQNKLWQDPKSTLQEKAQEKFGITPQYKVVRETGPDHDKLFIVGVYIQDKVISEGEGKSKQEAEQDAASKALSKNGW